MYRVDRAALAVVMLAIATNLAVGENWPAWRGPTSNGRSTEKDLPLKWSAKENVRWKIDLPGPGNSSPIVWGDRIFLTQSLDKNGKSRAVMCLQRSDGKLLWQKETAYDAVDNALGPLIQTYAP